MDMFGIAEKDTDVSIISTDVMHQRLIHVNLISDPVVYIRKDNLIYVISNNM